jgi:Kef-type K+ transport system membrane component KefB
MTRVFVPMFFTYSGLNTRFALLTDPRLLLFSVAAIVAAVLGKYGACWAAARLRREPRPVAARLGALMNARGLMQLIALNVGLAANLVSRELFTALVLVALVTTTMTAPLLSLLDRRDQRATAAKDDLETPGDAPEPVAVAID